MPCGQQEAVAVPPLRILRIVPHFVEVENGQQVGDAEPLADVALTLSAGHGQHVPAEIGGAKGQRGEIRCLGGMVVERSSESQSLSRPPLRLSRSATT